MNTEPNTPKLIKTPSRRAAVIVPSVVFMLVDAAILSSSGASVIAAIVFSVLTGAVVAWFLNRNYKRRAALDTRLNAAVETEDSVAKTDPNTGSTTGSGGPLLPPVGSWANPSKSQKFRQKWGSGNSGRSNRRR
jgi:hypothetical protein